MFKNYNTLQERLFENRNTQQPILTKQEDWVITATTSLFKQGDMEYLLNIPEALRDLVLFGHVNENVGQLEKNDLVMAIFVSSEELDEEKFVDRTLIVKIDDTDAKLLLAHTPIYDVLDRKVYENRVGFYLKEAIKQYSDGEIVGEKDNLLELKQPSKKILPLYLKQIIFNL
jgi:hypothetical protein